MSLIVSAGTSSGVFAMQIFIDLAATDETLTLEVENADTIGFIKEEITKQRPEYPVECQKRLIFADNVLDNGRTLQDYNIQKEASLRLESGPLSNQVSDGGVTVILDGTERCDRALMVHAMTMPPQPDYLGGVAYDLKLYQDGVLVADFTNFSATISVPLPAVKGDYEWQVLDISGNIRPLKSVVQGNQISFQVQHLSKYAIMYKNKAVSLPDPEPEITAPNTGRPYQP